MRVRMKVDVSGVRNGQPWPGRGQELEVPDGEGADLCVSGLAEPVAQTRTETRPAPDEAVQARSAQPDSPAKRPRGRPRKRPAAPQV